MSRKTTRIVFASQFLLLLLLLPSEFLTAATNPALSQKIEEVRREREILIEEQRKLQAELEELNRESRNLGTAVKSLDTTRKKLAADIRVTQSKIKDTDLNIRILESNVVQAERQITAHERAIGSAIKTIYHYDDRSLALDLISSVNFSEMWRDRSVLAKLTGTLKEEVDGLRQKKSSLNREKDLREKNRDKIASLQKELSGQKSVVEESQKAKERLLAQTKNMESEYQAMLAENLARQRQFEEDLYRLESELNIFLDPTLIPPPRNGLLVWPLEKVFVTQRFGKTAGAARLYASGTHNGVDFRAAQGTPVMNMLSGTVEATGNTDEQRGCGSYGRWILVKHPNGLTSIYSHLSSSLVKDGEGVATGQVIGYSGGTPGTFGAGYSTGPHLHVGLFASQGVSVRQFVESRGCKQVRVPIADIKAYLDPLAYLPAL